MLRRARYPLRRSKYANHVYDDRQYLILLVLRHSRMPYRQFCETMEVCTVLTGEIGLSRVPHFQEGQEEAFQPPDVDSTGYSSTCAMAVKFRMGPANDSPDFVRVLAKVRRAGRHVVLVVGDKGYDSEGNHEYVHEVLGGRSVIPVRKGDDPGLRVRGRYRREQWKHFDSVAYRQRVKAETVNSVQKRTMGSHVLSRRIGQQHRELLFRALAYNMRRVESLSLLLVGGFLHSRFIV